MEYLVAVKMPGCDENRVFTFPTEEGRGLFVKDVEKIDPDIEFAFSVMGDDGVVN